MTQKLVPDPTRSPLKRWHANKVGVGRKNRRPVQATNDCWNPVERGQTFWYLQAKEKFFFLLFGTNIAHNFSQTQRYAFSFYCARSSKPRWIPFLGPFSHSCMTAALLCQVTASRSSATLCVGLYKHQVDFSFTAIRSASGTVILKYSNFEDCYSIQIQNHINEEAI